MSRKKFKLWHSILGLTVLVALQGTFVYVAPIGATVWLILCAAILGSSATVYVATEVIEEVRNATYMLVLLTAVVTEFIVFFAFEYWYLLIVSPASFPTLAPDAVSLLLHSTMVFVFNPLYLPGTFIARALLLINILSALGLVLFILQNITQFRRSMR